MIIIKISGTYLVDKTISQFIGEIKLKEAPDSVTYSWTIKDNQGEVIGGRSNNVSKYQAPENQNLVSFARTHALLSIKQFRIRRNKIILDLKEENTSID